MGRADVLALGGAVLIALSSGSAAQYGSYPQPQPQMPSAAQRNRDQASTEPTPPADVYRAAACLVGRDAEAATELLAAAPASTDERRLAQSTLRSAQRCIRQRAPIVTSATMFRGAVAEALYEVQFASPQASRTPAAAVRPSQVDASAGSLATAVSLAECATAGQPEAVRNMLATDVASPAEMSALQGLTPVLSRCVAAGTSLNADRMMLRGLLAESLYRWSVVQRDGTASAWAAAPLSQGN